MLKLGSKVLFDGFEVCGRRLQKVRSVQVHRLRCFVETHLTEYGAFQQTAIKHFEIHRAQVSVLLSFFLQGKRVEASLKTVLWCTVGQCCSC